MVAPSAADLGRLDAIATILQVIMPENWIAWTANDPTVSGSSGPGVDRE
jgi:hypothetical protein